MMLAIAGWLLIFTIGALTYLELTEGVGWE